MSPGSSGRSAICRRPGTSSARTSSELEHQVLGGLDLVIAQLDRALESIAYQDVELASMVVADDDRIDGRYLEVHQGILSLLARQAPVAADLRIVAALLHVIRCIERMGDQCVNIAKLVPLSGYEPPKDKDILDAIEQMGQSARSQVLAGQAGVRLAQRRAGPGPGPPGRRDQPAQPRDLPARGRDRRRPRHARVGDVHDSRRAVPGADRRQHRRHRRAGRVRRHRPVPRDGSTAPRRRPRRRPPRPGRQAILPGGESTRRDLWPRGQCAGALVANVPCAHERRRAGTSDRRVRRRWILDGVGQHAARRPRAVADRGCSARRSAFCRPRSGDADHYVVRFYRAFSVVASASRRTSRCSGARRASAIRGRTCSSQDLIYVGGGSLVSLMGTWRAHGIDEALREAWQAGVVMCGGSAGSLCWFRRSAVGLSRGAASDGCEALGFLP